LVGDAAGHGLEPGMVVATIKSLIASLIHLDNLAEIFNSANTIFKSLNLGRLFMALQIIRLKDNMLEMCSGGMLPLLIYKKKTNIVDEIVQAAPPIGGIKNFNYTTSKASVEKGDVLLLQTDGFTERQNLNNEMFGFEKMKKLFCDIACKSSNIIVDEIIKNGEKWAKGRKPDDDITIMTVKIK
jgi:sigma-B regulation protein RsbU (phosphoserine phosphatase)